MVNDKGSNIMMHATDIKLNNGANQVRLCTLYCLKVRKYSHLLLVDIILYGWAVLINTYITYLK